MSLNSVKSSTSTELLKLMALPEILTALNSCALTDSKETIKKKKM
jgi:hypothetical protein